MGKCCFKPREVSENQPEVSKMDTSNVIVNNKLFNQDIIVRKGMKSGGQLGRTGDGDLSGISSDVSKKKD